MYLQYKQPLVTVLFFLGLIGYGQNLNINGKVISISDQPIPYANVMILKAEDSTIVNGTSTDEKGNFELNTIAPGEFLLKTSFVGYKLNVLRIKAAESIDSLVIELSEEVKELEGVTVSGPLIIKKADRLIMQVEKTSLSNLQSYDILKQTPGVIILNNSITVMNSKAQVYINDRKVYLSDEELENLLQNYSGSNIKSIEVITNPPAKYDADAGAVINIVTSKSISLGYKGSMEGKWTQAVYPKYNLGTSHYYKNNFLNTYVSYSFNPEKGFKHDSSYINFFNNGTADEGWESDFKKETKAYDHQINSIIDFTPGNKSRLSLASTISLNPNSTSDIRMQTDIFDSSGNLESYFITDSDWNNNKTNMAFSADYGLDLNEEGAKMNLTSNYVYYKNRQDQLINTRYFDGNDTAARNGYFDFTAKQNNNIFTQQLDFNLPSEALDFETGLKYTNVKSKSTVEYEGSDVPPDASDDNFHYDENSYAGYVQLQKEWKKWRLVAGLRGEYTDVKANSIALGEINTRSYLELFPNTSISYIPSEDHQFALNYKRSIQRPGYQSLNPFRYYLNQVQYQSGNPELTRAIETKIALDYTHKGHFVFSLYYNRVDDDLTSLVFQNNGTNEQLTIPDNLNYNQQYSFDITYFGYMDKWWYIYFYSSAFYMENEFETLYEEESVYNNSTKGVYSSVFNQFTLSKDNDLKATTTINYLSDFISGSYQFKNQFTMNIGFSKDLFEKRASLSVQVNDLFNTDKIWNRSQYLNQDNGFVARPENRRITLGFRYKFGNYRLSDNDRENKLEERERLEAQSDI